MKNWKHTPEQIIRKPDESEKPQGKGKWRMSRPAWNLGDGPEQVSYAATSLFGV